MRDRVVRRKRKPRFVRFLAFGVALLAAWVLSANTILKPYFAPSSELAEHVATAADVGDAGTLASGPVVLPMLTAPAMPQLAAATQPVATEPVTRATAGTLPAPAEVTNNSPADTATTDAPIRLASADGTIPAIVTAPASQSTRLASAAPTVGGADISDAAVIAKTEEPSATNLAPEGLAATAMPIPRHRPRFAAIPVPRRRPNFGPVSPISFLERLFGGR